jgi:cytochrome c553
MFGFVMVSLVYLSVMSISLQAQGMPDWAYAIPSPEDEARAAENQRERAADKNVYSIPGSDRKFTRAEISNRYGPADWFPGDHPPMPDIVAHGKESAEVFACGLCHMPNGKGRQENAPVSGLPVQYFMQQLYDFRDGKRNTSEPRKGNVGRMIHFAKNITEAEMRAAAEYYGSMPWTKWIRVVETETIPKMHIAGGIFIPEEGNTREPLGNRIIETPEDPEQTEKFRNPHSGFIAYVPVGAVKKGETLATSGQKTTQCSVCHGPGLKGLGPVPGIAGRSPSYMMRQLWDMKTGHRMGDWTRLMAPVVAPLSQEDLLNIVAYVSSLNP